VAVELAIDALEEFWPAEFREARIGALLHPASVTSGLIHTSRVLEAHLNVRAYFGPQHGYLGQTQDNMVEWQSYTHPRLGIPIYSLYGEHRDPTPEMLNGIDVLFVDLQDIGARYYTFTWTLYLAMRACERSNVPVIVHDRPNPLNGLTSEGPVLDPDYHSFVGLHPLPIRHGLTIGELAEKFLAEARLGSRDVVRRNWTAVGHAVAEHADARDRDCLSRHVSARRDKHFRRSWDDAAVRDFWCAFHRRGETLR
jgi:uncharacterized protein YbbC (DUF1343 family)